MANTNVQFGAPLEVVRNGATPAAPDSGNLLIYPKTDDKWYQQTSAGVETVIGGSSGSAEAETFAFFMS